MGVYISPDGTLRFVWDDKLQILTDLGQCNSVRVSDVESIGSRWYADLRRIGGPRLGPFALRSDAIRSEVQYIEGRLKRQLPHELSIKDGNSPSQRSGGVAVCEGSEIAERDR